jgi:hypothetical protein
MPFADQRVLHAYVLTKNEENNQHYDCNDYDDGDQCLAHEFLLSISLSGST